MGASGMGGGGKRANFELNLVPFIDLLSTLICFLLITAVWQELSAMQSNAPPKQSEQSTDQPPPTNDKKVNLTVALGLDKIDVSENEKLASFPHRNGEPDIQRLTTVLRDWKARFPDRNDVVLATDNRAKYKLLVLLMDTLIAEKFPDVGINLN